MFCSTVIPTIGRSTLSRAVISVLNQAFSADDFEVIVVNDSGEPLPNEEWQNSNRVQVIHTNHHERSVARNTGAAIARGSYLHFLDDDDWLLPGALECFWELANTAKESLWLCGGSQLVDRQDKPLLELHNEFSGNCFIQAMAGEWFPLQSSIIDSDIFFKVGGFNPSLSGPEDIDLCRRIALHGDFATSHFVVSCIGMGSEKSTTDWLQHPKTSRSAREEILSSRGVFSRMFASARGSRWHGRIARIYITSMYLNLQNGRFFTAVSRAGFSLVAFVLSIPYVFYKDYWRAIFRSYQSESFI